MTKRYLFSETLYFKCKLLTVINFSHNARNNIVYVRRIGEIEVQEIIEYVIRIDNELNHLAELKILDDTRDSYILIENRDNLKVIVEEIKNRLSKYETVQYSVIVDRPKDTAIFMIFERLAFELSGFNAKIFATEEAGLKWLLL